MGYDEKLIKKLEDKAQKLRRDVVISLAWEWPATSGVPTPRQILWLRCISIK